jgi:peptide chain release factor 1
MGFEDRLDEIEARYEEVEAAMASPEVAGDPDRLRALGKAYAELGDVVRPYRALRAVLAQTAEARAMVADDGDAELATYVGEELARLEAQAAELRARLELLLVPKDPNEGKDVIVEIRGGTGGQEAALWAGDLFEMYRRLAERHRWKTDVVASSPSDLGGFKEV